MTKRLLFAVLTLGLLVAALPAAAAAKGGMVDYDFGLGYGPNQGNAEKVVLVEGPAFCDCIDDAEYGKKIEGNLGRYEKIWSKDPIVAVTVKSGKNADFWMKAHGTYGEWHWIKIKGTKDISNYVLWTCPPDPVCPPSNDGVG